MKNSNVTELFECFVDKAISSEFYFYFDRIHYTNLFFYFQCKYIILINNIIFMNILFIIFLYK